MLELTASMYAMSLTEFTAELIDKDRLCARARSVQDRGERDARIENITRI